MGKESGSGVPISLDGPNPYAPSAAAAAAAAGATGGAASDGGDAHQYLFFCCVLIYSVLFIFPLLYSYFYLLFSYSAYERSCLRLLAKPPPTNRHDIVAHY